MTNDDTIREQAIEAAISAAPSTTYREDVTPMVDAVLAVAGPALRAEGWDDGYDMGFDVSGDSVKQDVPNPYRADCEDGQ